MTALLRPCAPALAVALASGVKLWSADIFQLTLSDGVTEYFWTAWDYDLLVGAQLYSSRAPWIKRSKWNVTNTMEVPTLTLFLFALNDGFAGGANIKTQINNGFLDGASILFSRAYMTSPGDTSALGLVDLAGGFVGAIDLTGMGATITVKGKVNELDQNVPRNDYQIGCNHGFCDPGCTLSRSAFTTGYAVGASPNASFIPWPGAAPGNAAKYLFGNIAITTGGAAGQRRAVQAVDSTGLTLAYPLAIVPAPGDAFTAFEGCDKTSNSGSGQSCNDRGNLQNYRGFEFVPQPNASI